MERKMMGGATKTRLAAMLLAATAAFAASATDGTLAGSGTAASPYEIADYADLLAFSAKVNGGETNAWAVLTQDINASASTNPATAWTPIAKQGDEIVDCYTGSFDGGDHVITGLTYSNAEGHCVGLFGCVGEGGCVHDVGLEGGSITGDTCVGGVVGINYAPSGIFPFTANSFSSQVFMSFSCTRVGS